jgi:hypothetical protein
VGNRRENIINFDQNDRRLLKKYANLCAERRQ